MSKSQLLAEIERLSMPTCDSDVELAHVFMRLLKDDNQLDAVINSVLAVMEGENAVITGSAGTGKSTIFVAICHLLRTKGVAVDVASPTNAAVDVLRRKGVKGGASLTRTLYEPVYEPKYLEFKRAHESFGKGEIDVGYVMSIYASMFNNKAHKAYMMSSGYDETPSSYIEAALGVSAERGFLKTVERLLFIDPMDYKLEDKEDNLVNSKKNPERQIVLMVDECSMVESKRLDHMLTVYDNVIVVGDPKQLPPVVKNEILKPDGSPKQLMRNYRLVPTVLDSALDSGFLHSVLTVNHRQMEHPELSRFCDSIFEPDFDIYKALDSIPERKSGGIKPEVRIIQCGNRDPKEFLALIAEYASRKKPQVITWAGQPDNGSGLWNKRIRESKGYDPNVPVTGEPLYVTGGVRFERTVQTESHGLPVQYTTVDEIVNGSIWVITELWQKGSHWFCRLEREGVEFPYDVGLDVTGCTENTARNEPHVIKGVFAYALTCNKAQGSSWREVLIEYKDIIGMYAAESKWLEKLRDPNLASPVEESLGSPITDKDITDAGSHMFTRKWLYTALTRGENNVIITTMKGGKPKKRYRGIYSG